MASKYRQHNRCRNHENFRNLLKISSNQFWLALPCLKLSYAMLGRVARWKLTDTSECTASVFCYVKGSSAYTKALHCLTFRMNTKVICRFKGEMRIPAI
jgi:hypothetical protein